MHPLVNRSVAAAMLPQHALALDFQMDTSGTAQIVEVLNPVGPVLRFQTETPGVTTFSGGTGSFISETQAVVSFEHRGNVPVVPEPGSALLLTAGLAVAAVAPRRAAR